MGSGPPRTSACQPPAPALSPLAGLWCRNTPKALGGVGAVQNLSVAFRHTVISSASQTTARDRQRQTAPFKGLVLQKLHIRRTGAGHRLNTRCQKSGNTGRPAERQYDCAVLEWCRFRGRYPAGTWYLAQNLLQIILPSAYLAVLQRRLVRRGRS